MSIWLFYGRLHFRSLGEGNVAATSRVKLHFVVEGVLFPSPKSPEEVEAELGAFTVWKRGEKLVNTGKLFEVMQ